MILEVKLFSTEMKFIFQCKFALSPACNRPVVKEKDVSCGTLHFWYFSSPWLWVISSLLQTWSLYIPLSESLCCEWYSFSDETATVFFFLRAKQSLLAISYISTSANCLLPMLHFAGHTFTWVLQIGMPFVGHGLYYYIAFNRTYLPEVNLH